MISWSPSYILKQQWWCLSVRLSCRARQGRAGRAGAGQGDQTFSVTLRITDFWPRSGFGNFDLLLLLAASSKDHWRAHYTIDCFSWHLICKIYCHIWSFFCNLMNLNFEQIGITGICSWYSHWCFQLVQNRQNKNKKNKNMKQT
jgi:hypothetical protein